MVEMGLPWTWHPLSIGKLHSSWLYSSLFLPTLTSIVPSQSQELAPLPAASRK